MKKLMNEVLPAPMAAEPSQARARVLKHLREALAAGAAVALNAGCSPFVVVDPMPPPAKCRDLGSVKDVVDVTATATGVANHASVQVKAQADSGVTFDPAASVTGGTAVYQRVLSDAAYFTVDHGPGATSFTIDVPVTCTDYRGSGTRAWTGRVEPAALEQLWAALAASGFPQVPRSPLVPGATLRHLAVGEGSARATAFAEWYAAKKLPGYREAFGLLDAVVDQLCAGAITGRPVAGPAVVRDAGPV